MDGGIRSGNDAYKALALGAKAVLVGRAFLYRLGLRVRPAWRMCCASCARNWKSSSRPKRDSAGFF